MARGTYSSPEEAVRGDIPERFFRPIRCELTPDGNHAAVLAETNEPPWIEHYLEFAHRRENGWAAGAGFGWDPGWGYAYEGGTYGQVVAASDIAPSDAQGASIEFEGGEHRVPVREGWILFVGLAADPEGDPSVEFRGFY